VVFVAKFEVNSIPFSLPAVKKGRTPNLAVKIIMRVCPRVLRIFGFVDSDNSRLRKNISSVKVKAQKDVGILGNITVELTQKLDFDGSG
jgi:hypothetical protein